MKLKLLIFVLAMLGLTAFAFDASIRGRGLAAPDKKAPSLREGSAKGRLGRGHHRTRYFIGGGIHRGK